MSDPAVNPGIDPGTCSRCFSPLEPGLLPGEGPELGASAHDVWDVIGGVYTIHLWHPDIFNRGIWLSQFMAKQLGDHFTTEDLVKLKNRLAEDDTGLRRFLMGPLGEELLSLLRTAKTENWHVYAALYELDAPALVAALKELGDKAHVVLSNGSSKTKNSDGNHAAAAALTGSPSPLAQRTTRTWSSCKATMRSPSVAR